MEILGCDMISVKFKFYRRLQEIHTPCPNTNVYNKNVITTNSHTGLQYQISISMK